jgi:hypothetical protein
MRAAVNSEKQLSRTPPPLSLPVLLPFALPANGSTVYKGYVTTVFKAKGGGERQSLGSANPNDSESGRGRVSQFTSVGGNDVNTNIENGTITTPAVTSSHGVMVILEQEIQQI